MNWFTETMEKAKAKAVRLVPTENGFFDMRERLNTFFRVCEQEGILVDAKSLDDWTDEEVELACEHFQLFD